MVKLRRPINRTVTDAALLRLADRAHTEGRIPMRPVDVEHAVEMLREAGLIETPRTDWYYAGPGESHYNADLLPARDHVYDAVAILIALLMVGITALAHT